MYNIWKIMQSTLKLLCRKISFWIIVLLLPLFSITVLKINNQEVDHEKALDSSKIIECKSNDEKIAYQLDYANMGIKVLDASDSEISDLLLKKLGKYGMFYLFRSKTKPISAKELREYAKKSTNNDEVGVLIYLSPRFEKEVKNGAIKDSVVLYNCCQDKRYSLFQKTFKTELSMLCRYGQMKNNVSDIKKQQEKALDLASKITTKEIDTENGTYNEMKNNVSFSTFGYAIALGTFAFIFGGILIVSTIIDEKNNNVFSRFLLSNITNMQYIVAKSLVILMTTLLQTVIMGIGIKLLVTNDMEINIWTYMYLAFGLGLIFSMFALLLGIMCKNIVTVNYISFGIWSVSCMLGGLYFSIEESSDWYQKIANLIPQHWAVICKNAISKQDNSGYMQFLLVVIAFTTVIAALCAIAMKMTGSHSEN